MFPKDIWFLIFLQTSPMDWIKFSRVCKNFYKWIITDSDARLWSKMRLKEHIWCFKYAYTDYEIYRKIGELSKQSFDINGEFVVNLLFPFKNIQNNLCLKYTRYDLGNMDFNIDAFWEDESQLFTISYRICDDGYCIWNGYTTRFIYKAFIWRIFKKILKGKYNFNYKTLGCFYFHKYNWDYFKELNESLESAEPTTKKIKL